MCSESNFLHFQLMLDEQNFELQIPLTLRLKARRKVIKMASFGWERASQIIALQHDSTMLGSLFIDFNRLHRQFFSFHSVTSEKRGKNDSRDLRKGKLVLLWTTAKVKYHSALEMCESCCRLRRRKKTTAVVWSDGDGIEIFVLQCCLTIQVDYLRETT